MAAGCTFLIQFDEVATDGGPDTGLPPRDGEADGDAESADADAGEAPFPPPCDSTFPLTQVTCNASYERPNCAKNTTVFPQYPSSESRTNDLVSCDGGTHPTCVQHCPFGCAVMPTGYADICDDCNGRPQGTYCVTDLRGVPSSDDGLAIDCDGGKTVGTHICGAGKCATKCTTAGFPRPSCCTP